MTFPIIYNREDQVVPVKSWMSFDPQFDSGTVDQVRKTATLPWAHSHVALMADGHVGKGCTVGSVIALKDAVSPAAVGIDIGCSMRATRTSLTAEDLPETLLGLRSRIEGVVPVGFSSHASLPKLSPTANVLMKEFDSLDSECFALMKSL